MPNIELVLNQVSFWSILLPLLVGSVSLRRLSSDSLLVFVIVVAATLPQVMAAVAPRSKHLDLIYNIYTPLEFVLISSLLFKKVIGHRKRQSLFWIPVAIYVALSLFLLLRFSIFVRFVSEWVVASNIVYTFWLLTILLTLYAESDYLLLPRSAFFWFYVALLFYAPCTVIVFSLWSYINSHPNTPVTNLWTIHHFFNISMYVLFSVGFIKDRQFYLKAPRQ